MKRQPLIYLSDRLMTTHAYDALLVDPAKDSERLVLADGDEVPFMHRSPNDSVQLLAFDHDRFTVSTVTAAPTFLMVQQSWYPGWNILIDGKPATTHHANTAAFGAVLPAGSHEVA